MEVTVRLYGGLKCQNKDLPCCGDREFQLRIEPGTTISQLLDYLNISNQAKLVLLNGLFKQLSDIISDGDEIVVFPPVGGG